MIEILLENLKTLARILTLTSAGIIAYLCIENEFAILYDFNKSNKRRHIFLKIIKVSLIVLLISMVLYFMLLNK